MPLSKITMSASIKSELVNVFGPAVTDAELQAFCDALGKAIVENIQANAVVNVSSVSGVTPGGSASGPGSGTIT